MTLPVSIEPSHHVPTRGGLFLNSPLVTSSLKVYLFSAGPFGLSLSWISYHCQPPSPLIGLHFEVCFFFFFYFSRSNWRGARLSPVAT